MTKSLKIFGSGGRITGLGIVLTSSMLLIFMLLTFDKDMALIYLLMLSAYYYWYKNDPKITLPIEQSTKGRFMSILIGFVLFVGFIMVSSFVGSGSTESILTLFGTRTPVFAGNKFLTLLAWGVMIPVIETALFFGIFYEGLAVHAGNFMKIGPISTDLFNNKKLPYLLAIIVIVAGTFMAYHFQTRGLENTVGLIVTFLFGVISCLSVSFFKQSREAILMHIFTNSFAVLVSFGFLASIFG